MLLLLQLLASVLHAASDFHLAAKIQAVPRSRVGVAKGIKALRGAKISHSEQSADAPPKPLLRHS